MYLYVNLYEKSFSEAIFTIVVCTVIHLTMKQYYLLFYVVNFHFLIDSEIKLYQHIKLILGFQKTTLKWHLYVDGRYVRNKSVCSLIQQFLKTEYQKHENILHFKSQSDLKETHVGRILIKY